MSEALSSPAKPKRPWWKKALKITGFTLLGLLLLLILAVAVALWILSPSTLTPIIEKAANERLVADVKIRRAELTFWKDFPNLKVEVSDITIRSKSLDSIPESLVADIPAGADSLLFVRHFEGSIDVMKAISGKIALKDVIIDRPRINLLQINDSLSNFNIFPITPPDTTKTKIPEIYINRFAITHAEPITYRSLHDSVSVALLLNNISLSGKVAPQYSLVIDTQIESPLLHTIAYDSINFSLDGGIGWSALEPYRLKLENLQIGLEGISATLSSAIDFTDDLLIESLDFNLNALNISQLLKHIPQQYAEKIKGLDTDMTLDASLRLTKPYTPGDSLKIPCAHVDLTVPDCHIYYKQLKFNSLMAEISADIDGDNPNLSIVDINKFVIDGRAIDINLQAEIRDLLTDPKFRGHLIGAVDFSRLPRQVTSLIAPEIGGRLQANTRFDFALGDLNKNRFHKIHARGELTLTDFRFESKDSVTGAYARKSLIKFGSSERLTRNGHSVDSMLVVRLETDTASFHTDGIKATASGLRAALGTTYNASLADTAGISPFGGSININRLTYNSLIDSVKIGIADASGLAMLRRFEGNDKVPQLGLKLNIGRIGMLEKGLVVGVANSHVDLLAHLRPRRGNRQSASGDSIASRRRAFVRDSLRRAAQVPDSVASQTIDFNVDNSLKSLLFRWNIHGNLSAERGRLRFEAIHLPNRFSDLDITLDTDSVALNSLKYRLGNSDFNFHGVVSNLRRALLSRRGQPLRIDLNVVSDTININQVVHALSRRAAHKVSSTEDDAALWAEQEVDELKHGGEPGDSVMGPLLVPVNIDAGFTINAANVIYSDLLLKQLQGQLLIYDGAVNLNNLSAKSAIGDIDLTALYSAPNRRDMNFGLGMNLHGFRIDRIPQIVPGVDSIMPMLQQFSGIVNAQVAITSDLTPDMYLDMASLKAAMKFEGDSLVVFDSETFRKISKWLRFKNKHHNMINHLEVEATIEDGILNVYPFILDFDRYKLGVMGSNNLEMKLNYHIAVLKSPIPFKFGINIKGTPEHIKLSFSGAKFKSKMVAEKSTIAADTRINLMTEMHNAFRRGLRAARLGPLHISSKADTTYMSMPEEIITPADSAAMIREGLITPPDSIVGK